jgi:hypothetical protein
MTASGRKQTLKVNLLLLYILFSSEVLGCEYLDGHWKSNKEKSMAFNNEVEEIQPKTIEFLEQVLGNVEITVDNNSLKFLEVPSIEITVEGETYPFEFPNSEHVIQFIECTSKKITFENLDEAGLINEVILVNQNTFWTSPFGSWREYFDRVK